VTLDRSVVPLLLMGALLPIPLQQRDLRATHRLKDTDAVRSRRLKKCDISEVVLNVAAILLRCNTKPLPEHIVHVCLARETTLEGDISEQHGGLSKQLLRSAEPSL
jgi:hypothetical protein